MSSSAQEQQFFEAVYTTLWKKPLDSILDDAPADNGGRALKYVSQAALQRLQLDRMKYWENVLFIREEYYLAFETLESWWKCEYRGGGVVVTGQPGIGKTIFLFYVLFLRLSLGLPTALQMFADRFFLFTETGASQHKTSAINASHLPDGTWALADSSEMIKQPCHAFLAAPMGVWIIQATSPKQCRWRDWRKQRRAKMYVMDRFSSNELMTLGRLLHLNIDDLLVYYHTWGPSARTCIGLARGVETVEDFRKTALNAANKFASEPDKLLAMVSEFDFSEVSHIIFAVRPDFPSRSSMKAEIPTNHLNGIVALAVAKFDAAQQSIFFSLISSHPWTMGSAGWIFEKFVHIRLTSVSAPPLTCLSANNAATIIPVCRKALPLDGKAAFHSASNHTCPFYWQLTSSLFTTIDGIVCTNSDIFLLQATVSLKHDVKVSGLDAIYDGLPLKFHQQRNWRLVFITPTEECARDLRNQSTLLPPRWKEKLTIFSCTFMVGQGKLSSTEINALKEFIRNADAEAQADVDKCERDEGKGSGIEEKDVIVFKTGSGPEEPDNSERKVVGESNLRGGSHMTMQLRSKPSYVEPLGKGKGKAVEKSVPKKRSHKLDPDSSSKTRRTKRDSK